MRKLNDVRLEEHKESWLDNRDLTEDYNEMSDDLSSARTLLAKVAREHLHKKRNLSDPIVNEIVEHFRKAHIDDEGVGEYADDDLGDVSIGLPV